jgi:hypothetical protein
MKDLELSERVVADILVKLLPLGLKGLDITNSKIVTNQDIDDQHFRNLMIWLEAEGICNFHLADTSNQDGRSAFFIDVVLTSKGFELLGHKFGPSGDKTLAEAAEEVASGDKSYAGIGDFVGGLLGGFTKSINS